MNKKEIYQDLGFTSLFTSNNQKIQKSVEYGYLSAGIHFAPYKTSGFNVCSHASPICIANCLCYAGHGGINLITDPETGKRTNRAQRARIKRTRLLFQNKRLWFRLFHWEMKKLLRKCDRLGLKPVFRPNLTSDLPWEHIKDPTTRKNMFQMYPGVQFMDYTAVPGRNVEAIPNYHLTFSLKENNAKQALKAFHNGTNVAIVWKRSIPSYVRIPNEDWLGWGASIETTTYRVLVVDGDKHDLRFLDPLGSVVGLIAKGPARKVEPNGFIHSEPIAREEPLVCKRNFFDNDDDYARPSQRGALRSRYENYVTNAPVGILKTYDQWLHS